MQTHQRAFDWASQLDFARVSCDRNPIHMDTVAARRTHAGAPIVHGIHALLWVIDCLAQGELRSLDVRSIRVQFLQPIYVGDEVTLRATESSPWELRARVTVGQEEVVVASFDTSMPREPVSPLRQLHVPAMPPDTPKEMRLEDMEGVTGCIATSPMSSGVGALFPSAVQILGLGRIASLASASCLVGMIIPGLHSLLSGVTLIVSNHVASSPDGLHYRVLSVRPRFRLVRIGIVGNGLQGTLETVSRMPPVSQPAMDRLKAGVSKGEFRDSTVLIVGGSRGLGELTSKLLAAGGGRVVLTYASGKDDAESVTREVMAAGGVCSTMPYDVHNPAEEQLATLNLALTHLYYFATPPIFQRKDGLFDAHRYAEFERFYVTGFFDLVQACVRFAPQGLKVFYPSSSAIDARPPRMTEYSMTKAAGEILCQDISKFLPGVEILIRRLPRLLTDQTNSTVPSETPDAVDVMLPIIREMHGRSRMGHA